jgi:hypothetical protein
MCYNTTSQKTSNNGVWRKLDMREYLGFGVLQPVLLWIFPADNKENSGKK